jgi:adenine-specific DNA-methyltransferase
MSDEIEKLKMHSPDLTQDNIAKIRALFPGCVTEAHDENGKLRLAVDFDQLRQELSDSIVEGPQERYHLNWPGKREALITANAPIAKTLRPCREESVDFDTTQNLFIEGDNLEALKLLQETYLGKVKMIYIDPPYNTGNDFVYNDDFSASSAEFLERSNQKDEFGARLSANTESNGRFHSDWLSMIAARLRLARNLLSDDGAIFVNIDDTELANLRKLMDEVFGEENFLANVAWKHTQQSKNDERYFSRTYNSLLVFRKSEKLTRFRLPRTEKDNVNYSNPDNDPKGKWRAGDVRSPNLRETLKYEITAPNGGRIAPPEKGWRWSKETVESKIASGEIFFNDDQTRIIRKIYLSEQDGRTPETVWAGDAELTTRVANSEIKELFNGVAVFDTPKPTGLIAKIMNLFTFDNKFIVLDFFAGSGSMAHAVAKANAGDGKDRIAISVQMPEPCAPKSDAAKVGYATIAEISKERIRRAGKKILEGECHPDWNKDVGFRVLKIDSSNMADVYYRPDETTQADLLDRVDNIKPDRTAEDLLFQVLLDWGVDLTLPIRRETVQGKTVFFVADTALMACFDDGISEALVKELAEHKPMRIVFKDTGFADDQTKINVKQIFKAMSPETEVKAI